MYITPLQGKLCCHHGPPVVLSFVELQFTGTNSDRNMGSIYSEVDRDQSQYLTYWLHSRQQQWQLSRRTFHQLSHCADPAHLQCSSVFSLPQHPWPPQTFQMEICMQATTSAGSGSQANSIASPFRICVVILWHGCSLSLSTSDR